MILRTRALLLTVLLALVGVVTVWAGEPVAGLWKLPAALLLLAFVIEGIESLAYPLSARVELRDRLRLSVVARGELVITNSGGRPRELRNRAVPPDLLTAVRNDESAGVLAAGRSRAVPFEVRPLELGAHPWGAQPVAVRGVWGLATWLREVPVEQITHVVPDTYGDEGATPGQSRQGVRVSRLAGTGIELRGLRDYQYGDPSPTIDWRATARSNKLIVRETERTQHLEIVTVIDAGAASRLASGPLSVLGQAANAAARLAVHAQVNDDRVGLLVYADRVIQQLPPGRGPAHLRRFEQQLAIATHQDAEANPLPAVIALQRLVRQRALIVWFTALDDPEAGGQLVQATRLLRPTHLPMIVSTVDEEVQAIAAAGSADWVDPYISLSAQEYGRNVRAAAERLTRLGAVVVTAPPNRLARTVLDRYQLLRRRQLI